MYIMCVKGLYQQQPKKLQLTAEGSKRLNERERIIMYISGKS